MKFNKTLVGLVGASLFGCATVQEKGPVSYDVENLGNINMNRKHVTVQFEARSPLLEKHKGEIQDYVVDFFSDYNIDVRFIDKETPLSHDSVKILGMGPREYRRHIGEQRLYESSTLGTADYVNRTAIVVEKSMNCSGSGFDVCEYLGGSMGMYFGRTTVHEMLHLFGLYHPSAVKNSKIPKFEMDSKNNILFNIMKRDDFEYGATLPFLQEKQVHDYLSKGTMFDLMEEAKTKTFPYSWSARQVSQAKSDKS